MSDESKSTKGEPALNDDDVQVIRGTLDEVKRIAQGGMAYIFRARQPALGRYIAVKRLKDELIGNPEMLERFRREAKALAAVLHQNVAHVYDFVESNRESYIVMEYIEGVDLSAIVAKVGNLPPRIAAAILLGVTRGVGYIHVHGLIHRDIKPSNIRITNRGLVKLMDFGIVMNIENAGLTRPGMMVGSPSYLSPEQVLGDPITPRADLFLLGIVLYEMLTGTRPFKDENGETVFQRIRESQYIPLKQMQSNIPSALDRIVRKCLQKNPEKRYPNTRELATDLERFLGPALSSRIEDMVLQYLDEEALVEPGIEYEPVSIDSFVWGESRIWRKIALWVGGLAVSFLIGFFVGNYLMAPSDPVEQEVRMPPGKMLRR
jgi:eukaryotic-like serine/threonine-protein kinase